MMIKIIVSGWRIVFLAILFHLVPALCSPSYSDFLERGQLVVTGFSGTDASANGGEASIDTAGASLWILDVKRRDPPAEDLQFSSAALFTVTAAEIGQVFGIALDDGLTADGNVGAPNIYAAATSAYGLRIVAGASQKRIDRGQADAMWMNGQFGVAKGGSPGSIWKINGTTGEASLLINVQANRVENSGPGLGGLAFDPVSRLLFVSDLQTGLIHRIDLKGVDLGYFDHGLEGRPLADLTAIAHDPEIRTEITDPDFDPGNPETWGFAPRER
jgi:hypothetical protein